jgi:glutamate/tyrosine decarboxylase-like PLP-dependent enzyme
MMNIPLLAGTLLVKNNKVLARSFVEDADYLLQMDDNSLNPSHKHIQCGRRNDALKVWAALKYLGDDGYEKRINNEFANAQYAVSIIKKDKALKLVMEPECINVCFQVIGKSSEKICEKLDRE